MKTGEIAEFLSAELVGDENVEIVRMASLDAAGPQDISFAEDPESVRGSHAGCIIVPRDYKAEAGAVLIKSDSPRVAFARLAPRLHPPEKGMAEIHPSATVPQTAVLGQGVSLGPFVSIGERTTIGENTELRAGARVGNDVRMGTGCVIHPNVVIEDHCVIGDDVILHAGVCVGADGFGYVRDADQHIKFPQIGTVIIENNVEIGANTCIDRGALGETRIGEGTKIDNLVQIAHNVSIGKRVIIAAQTGISGSTVIEDDCVIGGQVGMGDHARVLSGAVIGSQAGVLPGKIVRPGIWWGTPVQPLDEYKRQNAHLKGLKRLKDDVKMLKKSLQG